MDFAKRIQDLMEAKGISQNKLASMTGIRQSQIGRYYHGNNLPSVESLIKICKALGVTPARFLDENTSIVKSEDGQVRLTYEKDNLIQDIIYRIEDLDEEELYMLDDYLNYLLEKNHNKYSD